MGLEEFAEAQGPGFEEPYRKLMARLEEESRKIGLYVDSAAVTTDPRSGQLLVVASYIIGDVAWTHPVIAPENEPIDKTVREMEDSIRQDDIEEMRREWLRRRGGGHAG